jgi:arginase family enzyme
MADDRATSPLFTRSPSFFGAPTITPNDVRPGMVVLGGAPYSAKAEEGLKVWAREGPRGVREASLAFVELLNMAGEDGLLDVYTGRRLFLKESVLADVGDYIIHPTDVFKTTESVAGGVYEIIRRGGISVCVGGNHYQGYPSCLGFTRAAEQKNSRVKVGYIHIDGHLDFNDDSPLMGKYWSGTQARRIAELPAVQPSSMVWIGIQGMCSMEEVEAIRYYGATIFTSEDIHRLGPAEVGKRAGEIASRGNDFIDLSLDIDCLDAGFSPGTGSVTLGSLKPHALMTILDELAKYPIGAIDLTEVDTPKDPAGRSPYFAVHSLVHLLTPWLFHVERG